jgi:hypothetical protein
LARAASYGSIHNLKTNGALIFLQFFFIDAYACAALRRGVVVGVVFLVSFIQLFVVGSDVISHGPIRVVRHW